MILEAKVPFDDRRHHTADLKNLDLGTIRTYLWKINSDLFESSVTMDFKELCRRMNIADGPIEALQPKNVGLLFFNEQPDTFFPQTHIDIVYFPEGLGADRFIEKIFKGPLDRMLASALAYIQDTIIMEKVIKHPDRPEASRFFNYPFAAIEEALCNAVYHRSYEIREPIEVRILPEKISVTSFPGPDRSIKIEDIEQYRFLARRYRNRRIGEFLKELDLTEGRGTGIPKILRKIEANGSPYPRFITDEERTYFIVEFPIHPGFLPEIDESNYSEKDVKISSEKKLSKKLKQSHEKGFGEKVSSEKSIERGSEKNHENRAGDILEIIRKTSTVTIRELSMQLGISSRAVEKHLNMLKRSGKLKRIGARKEGWWKAIEVR